MRKHTKTIFVLLVCICVLCFIFLIYYSGEIDGKFREVEESIDTSPPPPPPTSSEETSETENGPGEESVEAPIASPKVKHPISKVGSGEETGNGGSEDARSNEDHENYKVELAADSQLKMPGEPGELTVWIGFPEYSADFRAGMTSVEGTLPNLGQTAKVTAYAPAFEVEPKEAQCIKLDPTGSYSRFQLTPKNEGKFHVSADVQLFDTEDCSGAPIPKAVESLEVEVTVDRSALLLDVLWDKFLDFWGAFLALLFAVVIFLMRKQFKKWFGFEDKG